MPRLGVYIHWPFCRSKCPYCDFFSRVKKDVDQAAIVDGYLADLEYYRGLNDGYTVDSVFFGGGTPSLLEPKQIARILDKIAALWPLSDQPEISLEANPNTDRPGLFADLRAAGINRLSRGVQALNDADLRFLGRTHGVKEALASVDSVLKNFDNHSLDLIYARPGQTPAAWERELRQAAALGMKHLSLYQLTIEEGTVFALKGVPAMEEEAAAALYRLSEELTSAAGCRQYEISNYAAPGFECRHNLGYWQGDDYVGVGNGAVGRLHCGKKLFSTTHPRQLEEVTPRERAEELTIMGLRLNEGIDKTRFAALSGLAWEDFAGRGQLAALKDEGLVEETPQNVRVTPAGRLLLNYVIEQICL